MANTLPIISFLFSILLSLIHSTRSTPPVCEKRYCGSPEPGLPFEFPFLLRESNDNNNNNNNQSDRCGYPGFDVFRNHRKQAILTLSKARKFVVKFISLEKQRVWINDPEGCLPRLFLGNIDLTEESPFQLDNTYSGFVNLTLFNCTKSEVELMVDDLHPIPCLSNDPKYSIAYASHSQPLDESWIGRARSCHEMGFASVPVKGDPSSQHVISDGLYDDIALRWITPQCNCEADQYCSFSTDTGYNVTCYNNNHINSDHQGGNPSPSLHKSVYFFPIVWGVSALLFIFWVILSICKERQRSSQPQRQTSIESNNPEPRWFVLGLDRSRIEKYPKIQLAESGQLPKSIDNVCSICLSEYKPKETLRSMPQCNHHFHVECIDVWLKMNATCPLCRNLPEGSALVISSLSHSTISHQSTS